MSLGHCHRLPAMLAVIRAYLIAVAVTYLLGAVLATQVVLARVRGMGMSVTLGDRFHATTHDLAGLAGSYLPLIAIALVPGLFAASRLARWWPRFGAVLYPLAGAVAVVAIHLAVKALLGLNGIAAVREWHGLALQALAGWVGGYFYFMARGLARR